MTKKRRIGLLSTTAILAAVMLAGQARDAQADCTPDPASDGDTVTCTGNDTDGFQADGVNDLSITAEAGSLIEKPAFESLSPIELQNSSGHSITIANGATLDAGFSVPVIRFLSVSDSIISISAGAVLTDYDRSIVEVNLSDNVDIVNSADLSVNFQFTDGLSLGKSNGSISNSGTITLSKAQAIGIAARDGSATLINSGTIQQLNTNFDIVLGIVVDDLHAATPDISDLITNSGLIDLNAGIGISAQNTTAPNINNNGTIDIAGSFGIGINVGADSAEVNNTGTILTGSDGISVVGDDASLSNSANIMTTEGGSGIRWVGDNIGGLATSVFNNGTITVAIGSSGLAQVHGIVATTNDSTIANNGLIDGTLGTGGVLITGDNNRLFTTGTITSAGSSLTGGIFDSNKTAVSIIGSGNSIDMFGGLIERTGADAVAVFLDASGSNGSNVLTIRGSVSGETAVLGSSAREAVLTESTGVIVGDILLLGGGDQVTIGGTVTGNIDLGDGADRLDFFGTGALNGMALLGSGSDTVEIQGTPTFGPIDGGAGDDFFTIVVANEANADFDLSSISNFEFLSFLGNGSGSAVLRNATGFTSFTITDGQAFLENSDLSSANVSFGTSFIPLAINNLSLSADSTVGSVAGLPGVEGLTVAGTILGDVNLFGGDDHFTVVPGFMVGGAVDAGAGEDKIFLFDPTPGGTVNLSNFINFEILSVGGPNDYVVDQASGLTTVHLNSQFFTGFEGHLTLTNSDLSNATLVLGKNSHLVLGPNSIIGSIAPKSNDPTFDITSNITIFGTVLEDADLGHDNDVLNNSGTIGGIVDMGEGNDIILRTGTVGGDVLLGDGSDRMTVRVGDGVAGTIDGGLDTDEFQLATAASAEMLAFDMNQITGFEHLSLLGAGTVMVSGTNSLDAIEMGGILAGDEDSGGTYQFIGATLEAVEFSILGNPADDGQTILVDADSHLTITGNGGIHVGASDSSLQNNGMIESSGIGVDVGFFTTFGLNNSGTLSAGTVGLLGDLASDVSVENSGEISAPVALMLGAGSDSVANSGTISGDILLGAGADMLENSGSIFGNVDGGDGIDTLMNLLGSSITGSITNFENISSAGAITLAPQMGPLIVPGNLDLQAGASLNMTITVGDAAPIQVGGVASLAGDVAVQIFLSPDTEVFSGDRFPIVSADGGILGQFDNLDFATTVFLTANLVQGANGVELELVRTSFLLPFFDATRRGIARALDAVAQAMPQGAKAQGVAADYIHLLTFTPRQQAGALIDRLQTNFTADIATPAIEARQGFLSELAERSDRLSRLGETGGRWMTSVVGFGEFASGTGVTFATGGAMSITAYRPRGNMIVGLSVAGSGSVLNEREEIGDGGHTSLDIAAFAGLRGESLFVSVSGGINYTEVDTKRRLLVGDIDGFGRGEASGVGYSASIDARYAMNAAGFQIVPQAALRIANFHHGRYTERGLDELGLTVDGRSITSVRAVAGANLEYAFHTAGGSTLAPEIGAFFEREIGDSNRDLIAGFIGDPSAEFTLNGLASDRNRVRLTSGLTSNIGVNTTLGIRYEAVIGDQFTTHRLIGGLRFVW